jgi:pilus assembly protein CpaB
LATHSLLQRPVFVIAAAMLLLALAGALIWGNLGGERPHAVAAAEAQTPKFTPVIVAAIPIARGQQIATGDVTAREMPESAGNTALFHDAGEAVGHMALAPVAAGAPLRRESVSRMTVAGLAAQVPEGYRAYSIPVSDADIAGGFVQTGDRVDLYVTLPGALFATPPAGGRPSDQSKSRLLLQSIQVLAVGTKLKTDGGANTQVRTVTLALKSADLSRVALAGRIGTLSLAIRNPLDEAVGEADLASLETLVPRDVRAEPAAARRTAPAGDAGGITVYDGRARTVVRVPQ